MLCSFHVSSKVKSLPRVASGDTFFNARVGPFHYCFNGFQDKVKVSYLVWYWFECPTLLGWGICYMVMCTLASLTLCQIETKWKVFGQVNMMGTTPRMECPCAIRVEATNNKKNIDFVLRQDKYFTIPNICLRQQNHRQSHNVNLALLTADYACYAVIWENIPLHYFVSQTS